jgi:thiamine transport system substrate-binding protein
MLNRQFQEDMPLQMFVYPVNSNATLPDEFTKYSQAPERTADLAPDVIAANRDKWIQEWTDVVMN